MRYILGVLAIIVIAIVAIFWLTPNSSKTSKPKNAQVTKLADYATKDSKVIFTAQGKVVGEDQFTAVRITVSQSTRTIDILKGYEGNVETSEQLANTQPAYDTFLRALNTTNFLATKPTPFSDERGVCPLGSRFIYEIQDSGKTVLHSWSTSCGTIGSFDGSAVFVRQLFQNQIPDYTGFVRGLQL